MVVSFLIQYIFSYQLSLNPSTKLKGIPPKQTHTIDFLVIIPYFAPITKPAANPITSFGSHSCRMRFNFS